MLDVHAWSFACPHSLSFLTPVSALEQDMSYGLSSIATGAFVGVGLLDDVEVRAQANLAITHLCDDRADHSVGAQMRVQGAFSGPDPKSEKLSAVLG